MTWMYWIVFIALLAISLTRWVEGPWWFTTLDALRLHWGYFAIVFAGLAFYRKRYRFSLAFAVLAAASVFCVFDGLVQTPVVQVQAQQKTYKVLQSNVLFDNTDYEAFLNLLQNEQPDFIIVVEFTKSWRRAVLKNDWVQQRYPYFVFNKPAAGYHPQFGIFSKYPLTPLEIEDQPYSIDTWMLKAEAQAEDGKVIDITAVHPYHPTNWWQTKQQQRFFDFLSQREALNKKRYRIVAGDFNAPHWLKSYIAMKQAAGLHDFAPSGLQFLTTWPVSLPGMLRLPLDHFLFSQHVGMVSQRLGVNIGSDHYPIVSEFTLQ